MKAWWFRQPLSVRVPLLGAVMMVALGVLASQLVLGTLGRVQQDRIREVAELHLAALELALGPHVLHRDVWEVYDLLDRARGQSERVALIVVADPNGRVLAASDPLQAPVDSLVAPFLEGAVPPTHAVVSRGSDRVRVGAAIDYQGRTVGHMISELDLSDLAAGRRRTLLLLILGSAAATLGLAAVGAQVLRRELRPLGLLAHHLTSAGPRPALIPESALPAGGEEMASLVAGYNSLAVEVARGAEADRQRAESERLAALGRLSASLAHEINNPLGGLLNATDTALRYADRPEVVREAASLLQRGLQHLRDITAATLNHHRLDRDGLDLTAEDLDDLRLLLGPTLRTRGQRLNWQVDPAGIARLPAGPMRQVLLNLLLNASQAAPHGGCVELEVVLAGTAPRFVLSDDGPGLPDALADWLQSAGERRPPSKGVGLRLVRDVMSQLGGCICVCRTDERTEIVLTFPGGAARC
ncbi:HAMP domain-containing sensor histidine kinase [uncultured Paracoccus sp.]|uniref:sensor histidine kinase n=1 Tax=uncultured Paracoccus sp. TaxID=189685 RepID=UPI002632E2FE|nr:HAMP domain-containing sensor histidine kinase [uncultured Paracoccus sp.]